MVFLVCEFEGFEKSVLRGWGRMGHPYIASTDAMISEALINFTTEEVIHTANFAEPCSILQKKTHTGAGESMF